MCEILIVSAVKYVNNVCKLLQFLVDFAQKIHLLFLGQYVSRCGRV